MNKIKKQIKRQMDQKPRSRANTVIGQIKWWTSNHHLKSDNANNNNTCKPFGSSVAVQKLRESKWFGPDETRIFCAVIECGFIVETREGKENGGWFGVVNCKTSKGKTNNTKQFFITVHKMNCLCRAPKGVLSRNKVTQWK